MAEILDGLKLANKIKRELKERIAREGISAALAVVLVGSDPASEIYVRGKIADCEEVGIKSELVRFGADASEDELTRKIAELNEDKSITGILVQLPLPAQFCESAVLNAISPEKDVDGFHYINRGKLFSEQTGAPRRAPTHAATPVVVGADGTPPAGRLPSSPTCAPCTPLGIIELLREYKIEIEGKNCVVIGRSNIVGKPMAMMLLQENGTVTICHSKTRGLAEITRRADILVCAIGKPHFITADMVKRGAVVIDVGMNRVEDGVLGVLVGDVAFADVSKKAAFLTPVPGGVGPMTRAMLLRNVLDLISQ